MSLPKWITNVQHIAVSDINRYGFTAYNIANKIKCAVEQIKAEEVLLFSDDYYLTHVINAKNISYFNKGKLIESIAKRKSHDSYTCTLDNTLMYLMDAGSTKKDCDLHYPIRIIKKKLLSSMPDTWPVHGYSIRSLYVNINNISTEFLEDNKINKASEFNLDLRFFSTTDTQINKDMKALFERLYSTKSKYEL